MKKLAVLFLLAVSSILSATAQLTAAKAFVDAPQKIFPLLESNVRMDMVDYFSNGLDTRSGNSLNGKSVITDLTPAVLSARMTDSSSIQLALLTSGNDTIIALVSTVAAPGLDSNIKFYNSKWQPLPDGRYFSRPGWKEWLNSEGQAHRDEVEMQVPFMLASYNIDPESGRLTIANNLDRFLDEEMYESLKPYLQPQLVYIWNGKKFTGEK
ncbi:MAG: DUF3256 family protein [Duncaniella sp.]|nr:DUF3256 family protein [Duncaniella sp.]